MREDNIQIMSTSQYDSEKDTKEHIEKVREFMEDIIDVLQSRAYCHDASKLKEPEKSMFVEYCIV